MWVWISFAHSHNDALIVNYFFLKYFISNIYRMRTARLKYVYFYIYLYTFIYVSPRLWLMISPYNHKIYHQLRLGYVQYRRMYSMLAKINKAKGEMSSFYMPNACPPHRTTFQIAFVIKMSSGFFWEVPQKLRQEEERWSYRVGCVGERLSSI